MQGTLSVIHGTLDVIQETSDEPAVGEVVVGLLVIVGEDVVGEKVVGEEVGVEVVEVLEEEAATSNTRLQSGRTDSNQSKPKSITFPSPCCHSDTYAEEPAV
jgi:hypothetical protein